MSSQQMFLEIVCVLRRNWSKEFLRMVLQEEPERFMEVLLALVGQKKEGETA